jgi:hypothetical protein
MLPSAASATYEPYAAPATTKVCERIDVTYQAG